MTDRILASDDDVLELIAAIESGFERARERNNAEQPEVQS